MNQLENLLRITEEAKEKVAAASSSTQLEEVDVEYLGRKGKLTLLLRSIGELPAEERPAFGSRVNQAKNEVSTLIDARRERLASGESAEKLKAEAIDVTLPGRFYKTGRMHPLTSTMDEIKKIFIGMGFEFVDSNEIEHYTTTLSH
jgi:phenylalanyl-tRNA synthetase alpha chain